MNQFIQDITESPAGNPGQSHVTEVKCRVGVVLSRVSRVLSTCEYGLRVQEESAGNRSPLSEEMIMPRWHHGREPESPAL